MLYNTCFEKYKKLLSEIDNRVNQLEGVHSNHMECKKGCDDCCMDYRIFPIEFYSILNDFKKQGVVPETVVPQKNGDCIFLKDHACTIYAHRPVICRTHGLPLLFMNGANDWELSACELNFTAFDFAGFNFENTFPQDKYNSELFMLNKAFIAEFESREYREMDLIPLRNLFKL